MASSKRIYRWEWRCLSLWAISRGTNSFFSSTKKSIGVEDKPVEPPTPKKPRKKRRTDPLKKKSKKPEVIKNLDKINKLSKGTELLQRLEETPIKEEVRTIIKPTEVEQSVPEEPRPTIKVPSQDIKTQGVEVVDVKAIEKNKKKLLES